MRLQLGILFILTALLVSACQPPQKGLDTDDERNPHFRKAARLATEGNFYGAINSYEAALRANPELAKAHMEIGLLYSDKQLNPVGAIYHFERYLDKRPDAAEAEKVRNYIEKAKLDFALTLPHSTAQNAEEVARISRENIELRQQVAQLQERLARINDQQAAALATPAVPPQAVAPTLPTADQTSPAISTSPEQSTTPPSATTPTAPRALPVEASSTAARSHTIKQGDSLWRIARTYYPDDINSGIEKIKQANPEKTSNPQNLKLGETLIIP